MYLATTIPFVWPILIVEVMFQSTEKKINSFPSHGAETGSIVFTVSITPSDKNDNTFLT